MTEAGTAYVAVVPNMANFSKQVSAGVGASAGGVRSAALSLGKVFGLALGATAIVAFAKHSLEAFDELEKASQRLRFGLQAIGQASSLQGLVDWAKSFSMQTGIAEATVVGMAGKLSNLGVTFFRAMGPQAAGFLQKLTEGLTNMSAATGKSAEMLMRSLAPAILNTPLKAIPVLQKLGAITDEQAQKVKGLVAAGRLQAATQLEILDIQTKYNGAAAANATLTDKLKNVWNQLNISIGNFISTSLVNVVEWFSRLNPVLKDVIISLGAAVSIATVLGVVSELTFVKGMIAAIANLGTFVGLVISAAAEEGILSATTAGLGIAMDALLATSGPLVIAIGLVAGAFLFLRNQTASENKEAQKFADAIVAGKTSLDAVVASLKITSGWVASHHLNFITPEQTKIIDDTNAAITKTGYVIPPVRQAALDLAKAHNDSGTAIEAENAIIKGYNLTLDTSRFHLSRAGKAVRNFANMTTGDFKDWAKNVISSAQGAMGSITDYSHGFGQSTKQVLRGLRLQTERIKRFAADVAVVTSSKLTDQQKAALLSAPNAVIDAWVHGPKSVKGQILSALDAQDKAAKNIQHNINSLNIEPATRTLGRFTAQWRELALNPNLDLQVNIHAATGGLPPWPGGADANISTPWPTAAGGIVTSPQVRLVGEAGPEAIIPLGHGGMRVTITDSNLGLVLNGVLEDDRAFAARSGRASR